MDYKILSIRYTEKQRFLLAGYKYVTIVWSERERSASKIVNENFLL